MTDFMLKALLHAFMVNALLHAFMVKALLHALRGEGSSSCPSW
jgi:hypothetical protein